MPAPFDHTFPATLASLAAARRALRVWLAEDAVVEETAAHDLLTVAGEFLLHVVVRTGGDRGRARLVAERGPDGVRLAVTAVDAATTPPVRSIGLPADPLGVGSIGRRLVDRCCDEVEISRGPTIGARCWRTLVDGAAPT
jgi:hypothetical protein